MPSAFSDLTQNTQWYLAKVDPAKPAEAFTWQALAARSYLAQGQYQPASALLQQLQKQAATPQQQAQLQLLQAHLLLAQGQANQALILLEDKPDITLDADSEKNWYRQRVVLQLDINNKFGAAKSLVLLEPFLSQNELSTNHQQIWSLLKSMTPSTLAALEENPAPDVATGWLRLAALVNQFGAQPNLLSRQLAVWKRDFPDHPAQQDMPAGLGSVSELSRSSVKQIAVLLPLSGNLEPQGSAIRNGMLMSYKENQGQFTLNFYDTQSTPINDLYKKVIQEGADMIIGPLLKDRVEALLKATPAVPVLALNELDQPIVNDSTYYFSLSAAADAAQAAQYLYTQGYRKPLLIAAQGRIGYSSIKAFELSWAALSQDKPVVATFGARNEVQGMIKNALSGRLTPRAGEIVQLAEQSPRSIDVVYMVANSLEARMIKPYVDISVNPMGSLPIFTGSRGYDSAATEITSELNGMHISDMPLLQGGYERQREQVALLWPQTQGDLLRLFAMGYDAVALAENLPQMRKTESIQQAGMSGQLSVDSKGNIVRRLSWGTYQNGKLVEDSATTQLEKPAHEGSMEMDAQTTAEPVPLTGEQGTAL
ncbi:penicillin-binding protein activator [Aeromonas cavernicola]|nr:penicillin-binding protein activator [Aeromonas cavernicola]